jgi:fatty-acyl-CoA synthase
MFPDGYISLVDRLKDIVISGGENVSSVEVERVLESHSAVSEAAVVGKPDDHYGEIVVAYVTLRPNHSASEAELIEHARARLAHFKAPKRIEIRDLPKTSTGKIQKTVLRELARSAVDDAAPPAVDVTSSTRATNERCEHPPTSRRRIDSDRR